MTASELFQTGQEAPLVSVVIPVYNVRSYLPQCLESVICQSYRNLEILLIDDGSDDGSGRICDRYAERDARIRVLHTENKGLASARNLGLKNARGTFISFIDSDDWIEPHAIGTLLKAALQHHADIVAAGKSREYVNRSVPSRKMKEQVFVFRDQDILPAYVRGLFSNVTWNKLYRSDCFSDIRFPDGHNYEDNATTWKLMARIAETGGTIVFLPEVLYHFRMRKSSITHTITLANIVDCWTAFRGKYEGLPEYREQLLSSCFMAIGKMWLNYSGLTAEEKDRAVITIREMQSFSKSHFRQTMKGKYSPRTKLICLLSNTGNPAVMWCCFRGGKFLQILRNTREKMFD